MDELKPHPTTSTTDRPISQHSSELNSPTLDAPPQEVSDYERKLLWKLDLRILPILSCLFVIMLIDRVNIGNVKIEGILKDLRMEGNDYNMSLVVYTVPFILFELPSSLMLRRVRPNIWISGIMFGWGICTIGEGLTRSYGGLLACRFLVGMFEAGFVPSCAYLISQYYKRHEFQRRYTVFFSASIIGGAFGGFLAYALAKLKGKGGYNSWRWIFLMEGIITIILSLLAYIFIVPLPESATFLTSDEKSFVLKRLQSDDSTTVPENDASPLNFKQVLRIATSWKVLLGLIAYFCADISVASINSFQPTILLTLGYSSGAAQIHTIPVYMTALVTTLICAFLSDHFKIRYPFLLFSSLLSFSGWLIEYLAHYHISPHTGLGAADLRYAGMFLIASGGWTQIPVLVVWLANNLRGRRERVVGLAVVIGGGQAGNLVAANVFITGQEKGGFRSGFAAGLGCQVLGMLAGGILVAGLWVENRRLAKQERERRGIEGGAGEKGWRNTL